MLPAASPLFDVLNPTVDIKKGLFLEASAGTGKTFTIENLVIRLLEEKGGLKIEEILVVTFTRAATAELKHRIRENLASKLVQHPSHAEYRNAFYGFDQARIFTLHGFCFHTLREQAFTTGLFLEHTEENAQLHKTVGEIIKDYFRSTLSFKTLSLAQWEVLLRHHFNKVEDLIERLANLIKSRLPFDVNCPLENELKKHLSLLKEAFKPDPERLLEDLKKLAPTYGGLCTRKKEIKIEVEKGLKTFVRALCNPFSYPIEKWPLLLMSPENRLKTKIDLGSLHYPDLWSACQSNFLPLLEAHFDILGILARLAQEVQEYVLQTMEAEEIVLFEDLLRLMEENLNKEGFVETVRGQYKAVLIDEFQDTDPKQWHIFSRLFLPPAFQGALYLVGDPKQSIYRFREADIYTYQKAKTFFGVEQVASLGKNYRSEPALVQGLNKLFSTAHKWIALPKTGEYLPCPPLEAACEHNTPWQDGWGAIHFCETPDEETLFSFIYREIVKLKTHEKISLNQCAILVKDRFQGERFLKKCPFPVAVAKGGSLLDSPALPLLEEMLAAFLNPRNKSYFYLAAQGPFFLGKLERRSAFDYSKLLKARGLLALFEELEKGYAPALIRQEGGEALYQELRQWVELLVEKGLKVEECLSFLQTLKVQAPPREEFPIKPLVEAEALPVMTIHVSKGLEFEVVFPVGLIASSSARRELVKSPFQEVLVATEEAQSWHQAEQEAEKMRHLYVACTRAKKRLYLPVIEKNKQTPLSLFLAKLPPLEEMVDKQITHSRIACVIPDLPRVETPPLLISPPSCLLSYPPRSIFSFSSLAQKGVPFTEKGAISGGTFPAGAETGLILHRVLEGLDFSTVFPLRSAEEQLPFVAPFLQKTLLEPFLAEVNQQIFYALHTPLPSAYAPFPLAAVEPGKIRKEMEFLFPDGEQTNFFKGFIDLFFEYHGKYYFLDWKSNLLENYQPASLETVMEAHEYSLQMKLYRQAVKRFLSLYGLEEDFAQAFYIFLRGLNGYDSTGIVVG